MTLTGLRSLLVNEKVVDLFSLLDKEKEKSGRCTVTYKNVVTLFPKQDESFRMKFSIAAQRTKLIPSNEFKNCIKACKMPSFYHKVLTKQECSNDNCFTLQVLKEGHVEAFCTFMLCEAYSLVIGIGTNSDGCTNNVLHCLFSIIDDLAFSRYKKLKPIITVYIKNSNYNRKLNEKLKFTATEKCCSRLNDKNCPPFFFEEQKMLLKRFKCHAPKNAEIMYWISYIPSFFCGTDSVFDDIFLITSLEEVVAYCFKVIIGDNSRIDCRSRICNYTTKEFSLSWKHWIDRIGKARNSRKWLDYVENEDIDHSETMCFNELICNESEFRNCIVQLFTEKDIIDTEHNRNHTFVVLSVIIFGTEEKSDVIRQFFSSFWLVLSLAPYCVDNDCVFKDYIDKTIDKVFVQQQHKGTQLVDESELSSLKTECRQNQNSKAEVFRMVSQMYMDLSFGASIDDVSLILKAYGLIALYLFKDVGVKWNENSSNKSDKEYQCSLNYITFDGSVVNGKELKKNHMIIPIVLCEESNINMTKLYSVSYSQKKTIHKQHRHVEKFLKECSSWRKLSPQSANFIKQQQYPYNSLCCIPNYFRLQNDLVCPVLPGNKKKFTSAASYLKYIEKYIGKKTILYVIDVVEEDEEEWTFERLKNYFSSCNRKTIYNQVSLEITLLPLRNQIKRPKFVEEIDWMTSVSQTTSVSNIQCYFITSVKDCFMDFHIDMGGSSVWYHVVFGIKKICLIEPTTENLIIFEDWLNPIEGSCMFFLPDLIPVKSTISFVEVHRNETVIIPSGYIHAVYTEEDSIVYGGNFLHSNSVKMQFYIYGMEIRKSIVKSQTITEFVELNIHVCDWIISMNLEAPLLKNSRTTLLEILKELENFVKNNYIDSVHESCVSFVLKKYNVSSLEKFFQIANNFCITELTAKVNNYICPIMHLKDRKNVRYYLSQYYMKCHGVTTLECFLYTFRFKNMYTSIFMCPYSGECFKSVPFQGMSFKICNALRCFTKKSERDCLDFDMNYSYYLFETLKAAEECSIAFAFDCINHHNWLAECTLNVSSCTKGVNVENNVCTQFTIETPPNKHDELYFLKHRVNIKPVIDLTRSLKQNIFVLNKLTNAHSDITRSNNEKLIKTNNNINERNFKVPLNFMLMFPFGCDIHGLNLQHLYRLWLNMSNCINKNIVNNSILPSTEKVNSCGGNNDCAVLRLDYISCNRLCLDTENKYLNDEVIHLWFNWISFNFKNSESPVYCCNSHIYTQLIGEHYKVPSVDYRRVKQYSNKYMFTKRLIFVPIHEINRKHWKIAIIINPMSFIEESSNFSIIICDSIIIDINSHSRNKIKHQTIIDNLTFWLREEWILNNMSKKNCEKRNIIEKNFSQYNEKRFFSKGQLNSYDCGVFLCAYVYETVQWLVDFQTTGKHIELFQYLNKVDQIYVTDLRKQILELVITLEQKQNYNKELENMQISDNETIEVFSVNPAESENNKVQVDEDFVKNGSDVKSSIPYDITFSIVNVKDNNVIDLVDESSECENKETKDNAVPEDVPAISLELTCGNEENEDDDSFVNVCNLPSHKQSNVNFVSNTATVITESVIFTDSVKISRNRIDAVAGNKLFDKSCELQINNFSEKTMIVTEIVTENNETDFSSVSASLDQTASIVSSTTSKKRKAVTNTSPAKKLNSILENRTSYKITYIRVVFQLMILNDEMIHFMNGHDHSFSKFKTIFTKYVFRWYVYCSDASIENKKHRYKMVSEHDLQQSSDLTKINEWKETVFNLFKESRNKMSQNITSDDVQDIDYFDNYENRGNINAPNMYYVECKDSEYFIKKSCVEYNLYYYNKMKDAYYGIAVTNSNCTVVKKCESKWIDDTHGEGFSKVIMLLWLDVHKNENQYLYVTWPGFVTPNPEVYECNKVDVIVNYSGECFELSPFILVANAFHLMEDRNLAIVVYDSRCAYHKLLLNERYKSSGKKQEYIAGEISWRNKKKKIQISDQHFGSPFEMLTTICTQNKYKAWMINHQFNLIEQHKTMKDDEMIVACLKANGCYLCITSKYILSPTLMNPIPYSKEMLDHLSYGTYIGIKRGIYICRRSGNHDFLIKFEKPFNHTVMFKISNCFEKGCIHVPKGKSNSCCRVRASQSLHKIKFKNYDTELLHNKRTRRAKKDHLIRLAELPIVVRRNYLSESDLKENQLYFFVNYKDEMLTKTLQQITVPYNVVTVTKDVFNIYDSCLGGQLYDCNGTIPIFVLIPRKDAIGVNCNSTSDTKVLSDVLSKYKVTIKRGSKRQGLSTHYATFGTHSNRYKSGLSTKVALNDDGDKEVLINKFFDRAEHFAKKYLPYGMIHCLRECKEMCNDHSSYDQMKDPLTWSSVATTCNYISPAHTDEDAFMSTLFVSHTRKEDSLNNNSKYELNQNIALHFCFPTVGVAVALRPGDVLLFNPIYYHCASQKCAFYKSENVFLTSLYMKNKQLSRNNNKMKLTSKSEWYSSQL